MPQITLLSQETIDQIAAGEVVERPSSVVKELVENAIDAGASAVTVEIKEGGISFIRITDNGCGIERTQVPLAFLRHSTSKIKSVEDLLCVKSLGFRGEALSSIAAVSQVELITKTGEALTGTRYVIEGSKEKENEEIGAPEGTTFLVRNLFYNTPARRKFLKTAQTEGSYISDLMERLALSHPDVSFKFINNGQTKMHTSGNSNEKDMIYHIFGRDITSAVLPVNAECGLFSVRGFIGKPLISRGNRNYENYFINGRYIRSALLSKAIEEAYKGFMMQRQYPFCVLYFTMDTNILDVNVHPTKMELRFSNGEELYRRLFQTIRDVLTHKDFIPEVPLKEENASKLKQPQIKAPEPFEKRRIQELSQNGYKMKEHAGSAGSVSNASQKKTPAFQKEPSQAENLSVFQSLLPEKEKNAAVSPPFCSGKTQEPLLSNDNARPKLQGDVNMAEQKPQQQCNIEADIVDPNDAVHGAAPEASPEMSLDGTNPVMQNACSDTVKEGISYQTPESVVYEQQTLLSAGSAFLTKDARKKHKIIGQLFETYWLIQYEDKLFIIDQHAAHEKVLYERTLKRVKEHSFASQALSPPIILSLSAEEEETFRKYKAQILAFGYSIEHFGGREYAVNAVPADFTGIDMRSMFVEMLGDFANLNGRDAPNIIMEKVASMSCKAAVKGNQQLSRREMEGLIDELLELENPYQCPHGRPTIISMSKYEIEKKFKRII